MDTHTITTPRTQSRLRIKTSSVLEDMRHLRRQTHNAMVTHNNRGLTIAAARCLGQVEALDDVIARLEGVLSY